MGDEKTAPSCRDPFFEGIENHAMDAVRSMLKSDPALVDRYDAHCFGATPISIAAQYGDLAMIDLLLEFGADVNRKTDWWAGGFAPIHLLPPHHRDRLLPALVKRGASWDIHAAAQHRRLGLVKAFIEEDPSCLNQPGGDGKQPLHWAGSVEVAEFLLSQGADLEARCVDHFSTPAQWTASDCPEVCSFFISRGCQTDVWMLAAVGAVDQLIAELKADPSLIESRLERDFQQEVHGPDYTKPTSQPDEEVMNIFQFTLGTNSTLLHVAAQKGHRDLMAALIELGIDPSVSGGYDDATPLHAAAWNGRVDIADFLLDHGADIDRVSGTIHHNEPLGWAVVGGQPNIVELLVARGAKIQPWHREGVTDGLAGMFAGVNTATTEDYEKIRDLLGPKASS